MKKTKVVLAAWLLLSQLSAQTPGITVQLKGLQARQAIIGYYFGDQMFRADSALVDTSSGTVVFTAPGLPAGMYFFATENRRWFDFMLDRPGAGFTITGDTLRPDSLRAIGSPENEAFFAFQSKRFRQQAELEKLQATLDVVKQASRKRADWAEFENSIQKINEEMAGADREFQQKHPELLFAKMLRSVHYPPPPARLKPYDSKGQPNNEYYRWIKDHYWDQNDFADKRLLYNDLWYRYLNGYLEKFTAAQPDSLKTAIDRVLRKMPKDSLFYQFTVQYTSQLFEQSSWPGADRVFVHLADTYLQPGSTPWLDEATLLRIQYKADINRPNLSGNPAPALVLPDESDKMVRLDTIRAALTLLIFYSPLCEHCMSYLPEIYQLFLDARPMGLAAVAVNTDNEYRHWKQFVMQQNWLWYDLADPSGKNDFEKPYAAFNLPVLYLLDKDKKILLKRFPPEDLRDVLQYYLKRK